MGLSLSGFQSSRLPLYKDAVIVLAFAGKAATVECLNVPMERGTYAESACVDVGDWQQRKPDTTAGEAGRPSSTQPMPRAASAPAPRAPPTSVPRLCWPAPVASKRLSAVRSAGTAARALQCQERMTGIGVAAATATACPRCRQTATGELWSGSSQTQTARRLVRTNGLTER